jgi:amino-acid N-acetyltransferase
MPRSSRARSAAAAIGALTVRAGTAADAAVLHELIATHQAEGHLLPRDVEELRAHADRFVVCEVAGAVRACAELALLSPSLAEVRSLVVARDLRGAGVASRLLEELRRRAVEAGHSTLCAFTHDPRIFVPHDFSIVPHEWLPEKIARDCTACPLFRRCGQHAMVLPLLEVSRYGAHDVEDRRAAVA